MRGIILITLLVPIGLVGCDPQITPPARDESKPLQTDRSEYRFAQVGTSLRPAFQVFIPFTYANTTSSTIYWPRCGEYTKPFLEKEVDGTWEEAWVGIEALVLCPPHVIPPGGTLVDTLWVYGGIGMGEGLPAHFHFELSGIYRLVMPNLYTEDHWDDPPPREGDVVVISNAFVIKE